MSFRIKTKIFLGLVFMFFLSILMGGIGAYFIHKISQESKYILKDNYESVNHAREMMQLVEEMKEGNASSVTKFELLLKKQELNVTEAGEKKLTEELKNEFLQYKMNSAPELSKDIQGKLFKIMDLNMAAIDKKSGDLQHNAVEVLSYLALAGMFCLIIALSFVLNFPSYVTNPLKKLTEGIKQVANKNYDQRLDIHSDDEFGELAVAFNRMASKLHEYDNSNLAQIMFEKKRIEIIINQMNDAIIGFDEKQHVLFVNVIAEKLLGLEEVEVRHQLASHIAVRSDLMKQIIENDASSKDISFTAGSEKFIFRMENLNVKNGFEVIGRVVILKNITSFKELDAAKTNFIATVSHELKTPIAAIKISSGLLKDHRVGATNEEQKQLIQHIQEDADRLLKITAELLDLTQIETGNIRLNIQRTNPVDIADYAVQAVRSQAEQKGITIETFFAERLPKIEADKEKTAWVLVNLLLNAIRYSPEKGKVMMAIEKREDRIEFSVQDFGKGIDPVYKDKIFDRYFQVPENTKGGTGLGLAISKEFIEAQNGKIGLESEPGKGSKFSFSFNS